MAGVHAGPRPCVVLAAARAPWEAPLLGVLAEAGMVVLRRCVDLPDLLAVVAAGRADVAVLSADLAGLDADAVRRLHAHDVRPLVVAEPGADLDRMGRLGVPVVEGPEQVPSTIESLLATPVSVGTDGDRAGAPGRPGGTSGQVIAVWGPTGAPGRTTVAVGLAAALAAQHSGESAGVVLVDLDPWGGAVAQALGVLDESSGLLAAARLANEGPPAPPALAGCLREVAPGLTVLTGLPRADRWIEVRPGVVDDLLSLLADDGTIVVVDCGFALERDVTAGERNTATLEALAAATTVVVVGSAEPTALSRLVRGLVEVHEVIAAPTLHVVVNRMRESLGWGAREVVATVEGFAPGVPVHLVPLDIAVADRAAREGRPVTEQAGSGPARVLSALAAAVVGPTAAAMSPQVPKRRYRPAKV